MEQVYPAYQKGYFRTERPEATPNAAQQDRDRISHLADILRLTPTTQEREKEAKRPIVGPSQQKYW